MTNDYMPIIMAAAFVIVLSLGIKFLTGTGLRQEDKNQKKFHFPDTEEKAGQQPQPPELVI